MLHSDLRTYCAVTVWSHSYLPRECYINSPITCHESLAFSPKILLKCYDSEIDRIHFGTDRAGTCIWPLMRLFLWKNELTFCIKIRRRRKQHNERGHGTIKRDEMVCILFKCSWLLYIPPKLGRRFTILKRTPSFFIIKPTRSKNFPNLLRYKTLHISDSSSVHHQEFIHFTLGTGICHTGL